MLGFRLWSHNLQKGGPWVLQQWFKLWGCESPVLCPRGPFGQHLQHDPCSRCLQVCLSSPNCLRYAASWMTIPFPLSPPPVLSYSMILVEIATRSDLNSVSKATLPKGRDPPPQYNKDLTLTGPCWRNEDGYNVAPTSARAEGRKGRHWLSQWSRLLWGLVHGQSLPKKRLAGTWTLLSENTAH